MKPKTISLLAVSALALSITLIPFAARGAEAEVDPDRWLLSLDEDFTEANLKDDYRWIRGDAGAYKVEDGLLQIQVTEGTLQDETNTAGNLFLFHPADAFQAAYTVSLSESTKLDEGQEAGIILYSDDDNYVKFVRTVRDGKPALVAVREFRGKAAEEHVVTEGIPAGSLQLRLERDIFRLHLFMREAHGAPWSYVGQVRVAGKPPLWTGVYAAGKQAGDAVAAIDKVVVFKPKPLDPTALESSPTDL